MKEIIRTIYDEHSEKSKFEKAKKINIENYEHDFLYDIKTERYFEEIDILKEYYENEEMDLPNYVYGCIPIKFKLNMYEIVKDELEDNHYEDAINHVDKDSLKSLQEVVDKWTESQGIVSYVQDDDTIILLNE
ncbi:MULTISPECIES: hypothetical protein [unclassified Clostridioides]|uniref:hypothetical protein n=1 Tax=unclassified Clostridioides TaxID=2635829 RepID=UPI001D0F9638|nr:hypothetical protein [Clostridioides sp. ES-S-0145-01]MCC0682279.1 hypothetical protein [Clostridioides sp. ES-S-0005-03]MCC0705436.1 hypothetical protein [Clostridioides sp. ES-S-0190-01]UDN63945.1 hypothetical protein IC758_20280 [Clostridioides sp. ES-W-0016-02]